LNKAVGILGCGWLGEPLARQLVDSGYRVRGSSTRPAKLPGLRAQGIEASRLELTSSGFEGDIEGFLLGLDVLVFNIPPGLRRNPGADYVGQIGHLIHALRQAEVPRLIYVSSTSVYGRFQGEVDETTLPIPDTESGKQLLEAEARVWQDHIRRSTLIIRFGGLLGPGRHPVEMLSGRTGLSGGADPVNLIRQHEAMHILRLALERSDWEGVVNAVHPEHPRKADFYRQEAKRLGLEPPLYQAESPIGVGKTVMSRYARELRTVFNRSIFG
jgi:nucleoside-diphosphate-sugar epimerase